MVGPAPAPRLVMSYGIYNSLLSTETIASEEGDKKRGSHPNQGIALGHWDTCCVVGNPAT